MFVRAVDESLMMNKTLVLIFMLFPLAAYSQDISVYSVNVSDDGEAEVLEDPGYTNTIVTNYTFEQEANPTGILFATGTEDTPIGSGASVYWRHQINTSIAQAEQFGTDIPVTVMFYYRWGTSEAAMLSASWHQYCEGLITVPELGVTQIAIRPKVVGDDNYGLWIQYSFIFTSSYFRDDTRHSTVGFVLQDEGAATPTPTPQATATPTKTNTPTNTETFTPTSTATGEPDNTTTPSPTPTRTPIPSDTPTETYTPTQTFTYTHTPTWTPTATFTPTETHTPTWSHTPTETGTPVATDTPVPRPTRDPDEPFVHGFDLEPYEHDNANRPGIYLDAPILLDKFALPTATMRAGQVWRASRDVFVKRGQGEKAKRIIFEDDLKDSGVVDVGEVGDNSNTIISQVHGLGRRIIIGQRETKSPWRVITSNLFKPDEEVLEAHYTRAPDTNEYTIIVQVADAAFMLSGNSTFTVNHGLGTENVIVQFSQNYEPYEVFNADNVRIIDSNNIEVTFENHVPVSKPALCSVIEAATTAIIGQNQTETITHDRSTRDLIFSLVETVGARRFLSAPIRMPADNTVIVEFGSAPGAGSVALNMIDVISIDLPTLKRLFILKDNSNILEVDTLGHDLMELIAGTIEFGTKSERVQVESAGGVMSVSTYNDINLGHDEGNNELNLFGRINFDSTLGDKINLANGVWGFGINPAARLDIDTLSAINFNSYFGVLGDWSLVGGLQSFTDMRAYDDIELGNELSWLDNSEGGKINFTSDKNYRVGVNAQTLYLQSDKYLRLQNDELVSTILMDLDRGTLWVNDRVVTPTFEVVSDGEFHISRDGDLHVIRSNKDLYFEMTGNNVIRSSTKIDFDDNLGEKLSFWSESYGVGVIANTLETYSDRYHHIGSDTNKDAVLIDGDVGDVTIEGTYYGRFAIDPVIADATADLQLVNAEIKDATTLLNSIKISIQSITQANYLTTVDISDDTNLSVGNGLSLTDDQLSTSLTENELDDVFAGNGTGFVHFDDAGDVLAVTDTPNFDSISLDSLVMNGDIDMGTHSIREISSLVFSDQLGSDGYPARVGGTLNSAFGIDVYGTKTPAGSNDRIAFELNIYRRTNFGGVTGGGTPYRVWDNLHGGFNPLFGRWTETGHVNQFSGTVFSNQLYASSAALPYVTAISGDISFATDIDLENNYIKNAFAETFHAGRIEPATTQNYTYFPSDIWTGNDVEAVGKVSSELYFEHNGEQGVTGTFQDLNGNTISVKGGIITDLN